MMKFGAFKSLEKGGARMRYQCVCSTGLKTDLIANEIRQSVEWD